MWNLMWSVCENNVWISSMWNSRCFAIHWGLSTCESPCETPCEVYKNMCEFKWGFTCESLCETPCEVYVKICVKELTSFHALFTYISLCKISHTCEICVWNSCEKCVKNAWKECENWTIFTRFFTWRFTYILLVVKLSGLYSAISKCLWERTVNKPNPHTEHFCYCTWRCMLCS